MSNSTLFLREDIEAREVESLAPYACFSCKSKGREYAEKDDTQRTCFQRDRDRIIHCNAYRRLKGKTQVFVAHHGDHFRNRLTHTLEVAQLARDFTRNLRGNEDLAETIALCHDLGHTPFGHAGQQAMQELLHRYGYFFEHNLQSRRVVEVLEKKSPHYPGLNVSFEVRDGLMKHRETSGEYTVQKQGTLEAQVVDMSDHIAYQNHDIDDGLRAGIFTLEEIAKLEIWQQAASITTPYQNEKLWVSQVISSLIKIMANDLLTETASRLKNIEPQTNEDIQNAAYPVVSFSQEMEQKNDSLKHFLYSKFYRQPQVMQQSERGMGVIKRIFFTILEKPNLLPDEFYAMISPETPKEIVIKDFIAGMTDRFALDFVDTL